jgi:hypothetical protein
VCCGSQQGRCCVMPYFEDSQLVPPILGDSFTSSRTLILARSREVAERFKKLNIVPRRLVAKFSSNDILHIEVDVSGTRRAAEADRAQRFSAANSQLASLSITALTWSVRLFW